MSLYFLVRDDHHDIGNTNIQGLPDLPAAVALAEAEIDDYLARQGDCDPLDPALSIEIVNERGEKAAILYFDGTIDLRD